jgi:type IV pilus assembly protein PilE
VSRHRIVSTRGFTLIEVCTVLVTLVVLAAIAIPMWRNHLLRVRRADAMAALNAILVEQDRFFGREARYAEAGTLTRPPPEGLGLGAKSPHGFYSIELHTDGDGLGYRAIARVVPQTGQAEDTRCVLMSIDQSGIRRAEDSAGKDRSADCWR